jgi:probable F420-dependent oxidoreductase
MKFGVAYHTGHYGVDPDAIVAYARHAEAGGFESLYLPEHVVLYRGAAMGAVAIDPTVPIVDPLDCLAFIAATTDRILLGTGVLQLPHHHPVVLAKRLATIDALSRGRMRLLTVGPGGLPGEAAALGIDFATRGRRADEAIDALRLLWAGDERGVGFAGEFFSFADLCSFPKPHAGGTLPIHVAGSTRTAARRAGRRGDGYFPGGMIGRRERLAQIDLMRNTAREAGRDADALEVTRWGAIDMAVEDVAAQAADGVTRLVVAAASLDPQEQRDQLSAFAERHGLG